MSLLKPTPGQIFDRISILELKIKAYSNSEEVCNQLKAERNELWLHLISLKLKIQRVVHLYQELKLVNSQLWKEEDKIRLDDGEPWKICTCAKEIARLNDLRMNLVHKIDASLNWNNPLEKKIYSGG